MPLPRRLRVLEPDSAVTPALDNDPVDLNHSVMLLTCGENCGGVS